MRFNQHPGGLTIIFHVYATGSWRSITSEQLSLIPGCTVHCTLIGSLEQQEQLNAIAARYKVTLSTRRFVVPEVFEHEAWKWIQELVSDHPLGYTLYFHTKGVTSGDTHWRESLNVALLNNYKKVYGELKSSGKDATGPLYIERTHTFSNGTQKNTKFFGGNFWLASNRYLATLPEYDKTCDQLDHDRYLAECFIGWNHPSVHLLNQKRPYSSWEIDKMLVDRVFNPPRMYRLKMWVFSVRIKLGFPSEPYDQLIERLFRWRSHWNSV